MVRVTEIYPTGFACNSYLVTADSKTAVMIDAGQRGIMEDVAETKLKVTYVLLTHGHFDHIGGCVAMKRAGALIGCHEDEADIINNYNLASEFGAAVKTFTPDFVFRGGTLELDGMKIKIIHTPGHTKGSVSFVIENNLFTGDTLFKGNIGRTDFATGSQVDIENSIRKLYALKGDYTVYAGHDAPTTLEWERKHNFYVRES